jgi:hypothetical protein
MPHQITLHLDDIQHLFTAPDFDLFSPHPRDESGIDAIIDELTPKSLYESLRVTIILPREQITADLLAQVRNALQLYTEQRIKRMEQELSLQRASSIRSLQLGFIFLGACLLLAALFEAASFLPLWLSSFLNNGFTIIGWVSLWHPTESLLFDWWPYWKDKRIYTYLAKMEIEITPESAQARG